MENQNEEQRELSNKAGKDSEESVKKKHEENIRSTFAFYDEEIKENQNHKWNK